MALVRVYCGLASADSRQAGTWLTLAVVDDSGRLLEVCDITDDPQGYAHLGTMLAERSTGPTGVAIAADSDDHLVTMLLAAAGRPLAFADEDSVDDFAERFSDDESLDEMESPQAERRAVGLARALGAGALSAVALPAPREMAALKPVLAAHAAVAVGRQAAAVALREVLRELYPAALRAYPDPAEPVPLAVLDAMPEPGAASRGRDNGGSGRSREADAVAAQLSAAGVADAGTISGAITALRVAVAETPRRGGISKNLTAAVANTVQEVVAAVRACDAASAALIGALADRANPPAASTRPRVLRQRPTSAPPVAPPAALRAVREATAEHAMVRVPLPRRSRTPVSPAAPAPMPHPVSPAAHVAQAPAAYAPAPPHPGRMPEPLSPARQVPSYAAAAVSAPPIDARGTVPPPPPGITPIAPTSAMPISPAPRPVSSAPFRTTVTMSGAGVPPSPTLMPPQVPTLMPPLMPTQRQPADLAPPGSRANWPLVGGPDAGWASAAAYESSLGPDPILGDPYAARGTPEATSAVPRRPDGRVTPPWQADDLPPEPPMLRLVEPPPLPDPALRAGFGASFGGDELGDGVHFDPPALRLIDADGERPLRLGASDALRTGAGAARAYRSRRPGAAPVSVPPVAEDGDADLLIFAAARTAWFTGQAEDTSEAPWGFADDGWQAAEQAARPSVGASTSAGLPKRVPQANLVPGSPISTPDRPLRIIRDPASIAAHTSGYFRGYRRGQEIGGYAVGGRPGRESAQGWDFSRDSGGREYDDDYEYHAAAYHSR